ncbi:MAG: response regulator [Pseudomonadota bacterium]
MADERKLTPVSVYLIEDDVAVADSIAMTIAQLGYDIHVYGDGETFLKSASPSDDDLVFIDLKLPGMSGREVFNSLKSVPSGTRVVFISGESQRTIDQEMAGLVEPPVLRKPLTASAISQSLPN